ncbi:MAG: nucleotidyltransferase family protein [Cyanobacteria bacterium]|nr:nucleotidyltransferase family protein [Cyanobacteriota bacterium]MDW8202272.1 nucleotidyltransferase family protein [Cyanobacteriota bacterium SKYGB_h_bin112]
MSNASLPASEIIAVILAGGLGTRVQHLLPGIPKPMAPVAGKPFLEWVVRYLANQGIQRVVLSVGYLADVIEDHFLPQPVLGVHITCSRELEPLGTAGGFLNAVAQMPEHPTAWLVLNGDSLVCTQLTDLSACLLDPTVDGAILGVEVDDRSRYGGLAQDPQGNLVGFTEKCPGAGLINAGVYLLKHGLLLKFPQIRPASFEYDIFPALIARSVKLRIHTITAPFLDIGTPESLPQRERFIHDLANQGWFKL